MLKKLRRRFIAINMTLIGGILVIALVAAGVTYYSNVRSTMVKTMQSELEAYINPESVKPAVTEAKARRGWDYTTSLCVVLYNEIDGEITILTGNSDIEQRNLEDNVILAVKSEEPVGSISKSNLIFSKIVGHRAVRIAFADTGYLNESTAHFISVLIISLLAFMVILYFISLFLANTAIRPIDETLKKQQRFIADVSHELKTPLTVILANDKILRSHSSETIESQLLWIDSTQEEAERMKLLVTDMLTLAQNESAETAGSFSQIDFSRTVSRIFLQFEAVAYEKSLDITSDIDDNIAVYGDENKIKQLCMVLIDNAIKYEPENGSVQVALHRKNGKVVFSVHNSGSVICKTDLPNIFDRFYRCDSSRASDGYGLGLSIAKSIVSLHNGTIQVKSDEQSGTTFVVVLNK